MTCPPPVHLEPWRALRHPLWWSALLVLVLNDHGLKGAGLLPQAVTGKLSDIAGPVVAPALIAILFSVHRARGVALCHLIPVAALAVLKLVPGAAPALVAAAAALGETWSIVADWTDLLVAVPAALVAHLTLVPRMHGGVGDRVRPDARAVILAAAGALACGATSRTAPQAPALADGQVVVQEWPAGVIHRFDSRTGRTTAHLEPPEYTHADPPVVHQGALWLVSSGTAQAIDLSSGAVRWSHRGGYSGIGAVDDDTLYAFVFCPSEDCENPRWQAVDRATQRTRWTARGEAGIAPVLGDGIVALAEGPRLVVRDAASGAVIWTRTFAGHARAVAASGGVLWAAQLDGDLLLALDAKAGTERARFALPDLSTLGRTGWGILPAWAALGDRLHVASDGVVRAYATSARDPLWSHPGYGVAASGDAVVVATDDGLVCLDAASGRVRWRGDTMGRGRTVIGDGQLVIRNGDSFVDVHDLATGRHRLRFDLDEGRTAPD